MGLRRWLTWVMALMLVAGLGGSAKARQTSAAGQRPVGGAPDPLGNPRDSHDPVREKMKEKMAESLEEQRHKRMVTDADKLLQLATELKEEVDKSTKNEMSVGAIKKAAEMEKLAHDVKERMKGD